MEQAGREGGRERLALKFPSEHSVQHAFKKNEN